MNNFPWNIDTFKCSCRFTNDFSWNLSKKENDPNICNPQSPHSAKSFISGIKIKILSLQCMSSGIISVCCGNTPHIEHAQKKNLFTLAGYACAERRPSVLCQVEADGCDRAKNHLYSGIHGDTVSTRLLSLDSRLVCWISGSLVFVRIFFFFSPCFLFFFYGE